MTPKPTTEALTVAVLYVDPRGPYPHINGVEWWGLPYRDARRYEGPWPVVAHPPCGPYGAFRHLSKQDPSCALRAVDQVRCYRGVLEHPAHSKLWEAVAIPYPGQPDDHHGGYTVEVDQCDWGHACRKNTWLYCVGVPRERHVSPAKGSPTHDMMGSRGKNRNVKRRPGVIEASAEIRRRTPPAFAEYLVSLARSVTESRAA